MKARFHGGIFLSALTGLIGREPDRPFVCSGWDGFYHFTYLPKDEADAKMLRSHANIIAEWMDEYDLVFSKSRCEFGVSRTHLKNGADMLEIIIRHPVDDGGAELRRKVDRIEETVNNIQHYMPRGGGLDQ